MDLHHRHHWRYVSVAICGGRQLASTSADSRGGDPGQPGPLPRKGLASASRAHLRFAGGDCSDDAPCAVRFSKKACVCSAEPTCRSTVRSTCSQEEEEGWVDYLKRSTSEAEEEMQKSKWVETQGKTIMHASKKKKHLTAKRGGQEKQRHGTALCLYPQEAQRRQGRAVAKKGGRHQ